MTNLLYSFRRCPYAMRARMALKYSGVKVKIHEVSLKDKPEALLEISPKGQVPVLLTSDKKVIEESLDIIHFALSINDPQGWRCKDEGVLKEIEDLIKVNDTDFKKNLDEYKYFVRHQGSTLEDCRSKGEEFLKILEEKLGQNNYLFDAKISYGDIAIFPFIRQFAHVDKIWFYQTPYHNLQRWLDYFLNLQLFNDIMVKPKKF